MNIRNMIEYEANRFISMTAPAANDYYQIDTHAEENGWDATAIQTACAMLPQHENRKSWLNKLYEYRLTALATSNDLQNDRVMEGRKINEWITGYNIDSIGALGNHGAYPHPEYMAAPLRHTIEGAIFFKLAGLEIPDANRFNCDLVYQSLCTHIWNGTSTIYKMDGSIYWPIDIEEDRRFEFITFGILDLGAQFLEYCRDFEPAAYFWEEKHTRKALEMN